MNKINNSWIYATLIASFVLSGCNELSVDYNNQSEGGITPEPEPTAPDAVSVDFVPERTKVFSFVWTDAEGATSYRLLENPDGMSGFTQVGDDVDPGVEYASMSYDGVSLTDRVDAQYMIESCNDVGCSQSDIIYVADSITESVGYLKSTNTSEDYEFGYVVKLSGDGNTLAIGQPSDKSTSTGVYADPEDASGLWQGSVQVFTKVDGKWEFDAYIRPDSSVNFTYFGSALDLSEDGTELFAGFSNDDSGVAGNSLDTSLSSSGSVYVFTKTSGVWAKTDYLQAGTIKNNARFGQSLDLSKDGQYLAVGAPNDSSGSNVINGNESDTSAAGAGSVTVFVRNPDNTWSQHAYIKASDAAADDYFGTPVQISDDGSVLAVGAYRADGVGNSAERAGVGYIYKRSGVTWTEDAMVEASNAKAQFYFSVNIDLSGDGTTFVASSRGQSSVGGINNDQLDDSASESGAVYVFKDSGTSWDQEAFIKADRPFIGGNFGRTALILNETGDKLYVGENGNRASSKGIDGDSFSEGKIRSGAFYIFEKTAGSWSKAHFIKSPNPESYDEFGYSGDVSSDGSILAIGAYNENGNGKLLEGNPANNDTPGSGAVFIY